MKKIPTAEEFLINAGFPGHAKHSLAKKWMIEFAKMHVEAALKAKGQAMTEKSYEDSSFCVSELDAFTQDSYPLENIK
jgi:hypothetical protein